MCSCIELCVLFQVWCLGIGTLECWGMWGIFCSSICLRSEVLVWVGLLVLPILVCIWFWLVCFWVMDFSSSTLLCFGVVLGFLFVWFRIYVVQCLFTSLWIVLWWWLYVVVSHIFSGMAGCDLSWDLICLCWLIMCLGLYMNFCHAPVIFVQFTV